jgi:hypothetical protein
MRNPFRSSRWRLTVTVMAMFFLPHAVPNLAAITLTDASWSGTFGAPSCGSPFDIIQPYSGSTPPSIPSVNETCTDGAVLTGSMSGAGGIDPQISVFWSGHDSSPFFAGGIGLGNLGVSYEAVVLPADPSHPVSVPSVPLILSFSATTACNNTDPVGRVDNAFGGWSVSDPAGTVSGGCTLGTATGNGFYQQTFSVQPGQPFTIQASVSAQVNSGTDDSSLPLAFTPVGESASVVLDPLTQIDPSFAFANNFVIELSPSLGTDVPEPDLVLPLGVVLLGMARRRKLQP